ncbi:ATPase family AAA domain-containing protein 5 [Drosophila innubila]|uniref:ATPase family AAA domain-containing protein 5 n=1 Tax=Drosophila innubila TaxID=198719 RepID=UPI00148DA039|nr:ATPase family AAA domain-containing protein 5 [Drosophila innubila]
MTDVNCFTSEHATTTTTAVADNTTTTPTKNVLHPRSASPTSPFILRAPPSAKSKLILQNMEEVLNSVKQKHREKHKRKREEKRRAAAEAEQAQQMTTTVTGTTTTSNGSNHVPANNDDVDEKPKPLREKTARENGIGNGKRKSTASPLKSSTPQATDNKQTSIMKHFTKTESNTKAATKTATNVFELMMSARNRSLGTNTNGQSPEQADGDTSVATPLSKRKQMLQDWNERKGGAKRRLADEARADYIDNQMEQRAKRLKKMLTQPELMSSKANQKQETLPSSAPVKRGRGRPRTRRLSADVDVVTPDSSHVDVETVDFLSKLSSPTKKRDSLLGYFPKVESPKDAPDAEKIEVLSIETPKRRPRNSKAVVNTPVIVADTTTTTTTTPSGRPRRSCASKARYDYDLEASPTKLKQTVEPKETAANDSIEIIDLDNSNPAATPKKLAPLFVRQLPKPSPDPTALRARQEFLKSGVPEKLKQEQSRQRSYEQYYEESYELFPRIAHVASAEQHLADATLPIKLPYALRGEDVNESVEVTVRKCNLGSITSCSATDFVARKKRQLGWTPLPQLDNKRAMVKNWKSVFDRFPTFKCYNQMREKYRHFSAIDAAQDTQPMGESFVVTRSTRRSMEAQQQPQQEEDAKPPVTAPNGELLFTEKYKPLLFEQVLVNLTPVQELREFLSNWNGAGNRNSQTLDDTMDFGNDSSSMGANCNTMVLLGPCSSGKTNAVFALANDMNFNVLEVNAGMRRTGKKLIQELQEATQSHQIRKDAKAGAAPAKQLLQKLQLNGLKAKKQQGIEEEVRKSLILIEDADILFENTDAGFTDAIYTLAASSKRPVIIVATDPNCSHLQRLMQQNTIHFQSPNALNISRFLAVLALMENCPIELDELISLYLYNNQNLRKTLMELQFFIQSGGDGPSTRLQSQAGNKSPSRSPSKSARLATLDGVHIHQRLFEYYTSAQNVQQYIPFPVDFRLLRLNLNELMRNSTLLQEQSTAPGTQGRGSGTSNANATAKRKSRSPKKAWLSNATNQKSSLATLANFYEYLSTATLLEQEQEHYDGLQPHLAEELAHTLVERAVTTCLAAKEYAYNLFDKSEERINLTDQLGSYCVRTSSSRALDYEPTLRSICRSEKQRAGLERRSSRFYHYLRNCVANNVTSFSTELYDVACNVLQEQTETEMPATESNNS